MNALIAKERYHFHERLFETNTLTLTKAGVASNADTSSRGSKAIAKRVVDILVEEQQHKINMVEKISGQTLGKQFEMLTMEFLQATFPNLQNLYPGKWSILQLGNNNKLKTSDFEQYEHLAYLSALTAENAQLAAALGNDYLVAPDVVVYRELFEDDEINQNQCIVDNDVSKMADIRKVNGGKEAVVRPLANALKEKGLNVWYDEFELKIGDSLRRKIDQGLAKSRFGIVVISRSFIKKGWTNYELDGLMTKAISGQQTLLPIWHDITKQEVIDYSPSLADKVARNTSQETVEEIANEIADMILGNYL